MHLWRLALHPAPSTCPSLKFAQTSPARCTRDIFRPYILLWNNHIWNNIFSCTPGIRGAPQSQDSDRLRAARSRALPLAPARPCRAAITCISLSLSLSLSLYIYIYIYIFFLFTYIHTYIYIYIYIHTHIRIPCIMSRRMKASASSREGVHPVRIARFHVTRFLPRVGSPSNPLFYR